ncbi:conserved Plasmodium protein, unknown function [Plasmodium ovale wallikeri]|uniref:Uncharacterized protein n=2 Tax=Plasmodium ovale TaxID=36330 RepID=A0A1A8YQN7_PLAOA|nr:conserved Plasmodium protein, unknown function [Plasmodium ovale wallikeri]SBT34435.1 conserved Plasmodium protein, unknown function [Plasmodium ovale wallikeri]
MVNKVKMERSAILSERLEKGVSSLVNVLLKSLIFNLYYSFDKIKENDLVTKRRKSRGNMFNWGNLEKSKKNIEKVIGLCLVILKTVVGDNKFFIQHVLENYTGINLSDNEEKKKKKKKFNDTLLMYHLYNNASQPRRGNLFREAENRDRKSTHLEGNIFIGKDELNSYIHKISIIDSHIDKHKIYSKKDLIGELNNFLNNFYLNKFPAKKFNKELSMEKKKKNLTDDDYVTVNLFSDYFNNCRKSNKVNILIKEINLDTLKKFHNILYKNINFIRTFNAEKCDTQKINSLDLSSIFQL